MSWVLTLNHWLNWNTVAMVTTGGSWPVLDFPAIIGKKLNNNSFLKSTDNQYIFWWNYAKIFMGSGFYWDTVYNRFTHTYTYTGFPAILPGEPELASFLLDSASAYFLFNTIPPCPSESGEGTAVKEVEWRESTFHDGDCCWDFFSRMSFLSQTGAKDIHWTSSFLELPTDSWEKDIVSFCVCCQKSIT